MKNRGKWITRMFLSYWEDESTRPALVAVYRASLSDEATAKAFRNEIEATFASCLGRIAPEETERTPAFMSLVSAQLVGLAILRYVLAVEPLASLERFGHRSPGGQQPPVTVDQVAGCAGGQHPCGDHPRVAGHHYQHRRPAGLPVAERDVRLGKPQVALGQFTRLIGRAGNRIDGNVSGP